VPTGVVAVMTTHDDATRAGLLAAILAHPEDDDRRLVYADWLDDCGEGARAEFIRVQVELSQRACPRSHFESEYAGGVCVKCQTPENRAAGDALRKREQELWASQNSANDWLIPDPIPQPAHVVTDQDHMASVIEPTSFPIVIFRRGFADEFRGSAEDWLRHADELLAAHPVRRVRLTTMPAVVTSRPQYNRGGHLKHLRDRPNQFRWYGIDYPDEHTVPHLLAAHWPRIAFTLPTTPTSEEWHTGDDGGLEDMNPNEWGMT
jgi:uncharacterized protein (TIGR02996 family)